MGAKTWMLISSNGDAVKTLTSGIEIDRVATDNLVNTLFPGEKLEQIEDGDLYSTNPPDQVIYAGCYGDVNILAAVEFALDKPSQLDPRFLTEPLGRVIYTHAMHSVVDWHAFSKWENGQLLRALSLSPDDGIIEDIGTHLEFEAPYWEGKFPAIDPEDVDEFHYPFPFHPLDLGEAALAHCLGYQIEGYSKKNCVEPEKIILSGYKRGKAWWKFW